MQVDLVKPMLKPSVTKHLRLKCDVQLSTFAFRFNLRRYTEGMAVDRAREAAASLAFPIAAANSAAKAAADIRGEAEEAGAYTRPLLSST